MCLTQILAECITKIMRFHSRTICDRAPYSAEEGSRRFSDQTTKRDAELASISSTVLAQGEVSEKDRRHACLHREDHI